MEHLWMQKLINVNFARLTLLNLNFTPSKEKVPMMVKLWVEIFTDSIGLVNEVLDTPRINKAFKTFEKHATHWPTPAQVLEFLPRRENFEQLTHDLTPQTNEEILASKRGFIITHAVLDGLLSREVGVSLVTGDEFLRKDIWYEQALVEMLATEHEMC